MKKLIYIKILFLLLLVSIFLPKLYSDTIPLPEEESSPVLINTAKDDDNVQLFLAGNWEIDLFGGIGFGWTSQNGIDNNLCYSGISPGITFSQAADITISLMIINKILFEASFTDNFEDSGFMIGYRGNKNDFLQKINIGNMGLNLSENTAKTNYFSVHSGAQSSFGAYSLMSGPFSDHQLLVRFDPQGELSKLYIGKDYVIEYEIETCDYIRGQLFFIPSFPDDVEFYLECDKNDADITENKDNRYFKKASTSEYSYSSNNGRLYLSEPVQGAVLAQSVSSNLEEKAPDGKIFSTDAGDLLLIYDPGYFIEYEAASAYNLNTTIPEKSYKTRAFLSQNTASAEKGIELTVETLPEDGIIIIETAPGGTQNFPLYGLIENPENVYGIESSFAKNRSSKKIIIQIREETDSYTLEEPIEGSIKIYINGVQTYNWTETDGVISFEQNINDSDRIEITYKSNSSEETTNSLILASANSFNISKDWIADINLAGNINFGTAYSKPSEEFSSYAAVSAGIRYDNSPIEDQKNEKGLTISSGISTGLKIYTENASGNLLLKNMSDNQLEIDINRSSILPASLSLLLKDKLGLKNQERGILYYKDYRISSGIAGYSLQAYDYPNLDSNAIFSPADSSNTKIYPAGPYIVAPSASDNRSSALLAMDYQLKENKNWVGVQLPLTNTKNLDLSSYRSISFDWKSEGDLKNIDLYLEIGSISEDLDGDGVLDSEPNKYSLGYIFNDPNSNTGTLLGGDNIEGNNAYKDSEDRNQNGFADNEKPESIAFFKISDSEKPDSDWKHISIHFSSLSSNFEDSRKRLKNAEFLRITAVNTGITPQEGRILFDDFLLEGASMYEADDEENTGLEFTEKSENNIPQIYAAESSLNSPTIDKMGDNQVLNIKWNEENWKLFSYIQPQSPDSYNSIIFYIHTPVLIQANNDSPEFFLNLLDSDGRGIKARFPFNKSKDWEKIEVITGLSKNEDPQIKINDVLIPGAEVDVDNDAKDLYRLEVGTKNAKSGIVYIDEIFLSSPKLRISGGLSTDFSITSKEPLFEIGKINIIGSSSFEFISTADYIENDNIFSGDGNYSAVSNLKSKFFFFPISFSINLLYNDFFQVSAGHEFTIPILSNLFNINDIFFINDFSDGDFSKKNNLKIKTNFLKGVIAGFTATQSSDQLERKWFSELDIETGIFALNLLADFTIVDQKHKIIRDQYFSAWLNTTTLAIDFTETEKSERKITFSLSPQINTKPVGLKTEIAIETEIDNKNENTNSLSALISIPIKIESFASGINAELSYKRFGDFVSDTSSIDLTGDITNMFSIIGKRGYLFTSIPFLELFDKELPAQVFVDCKTAEIDTSKLNNSFTLKISRDYSSRILDLFLPYSLEFQLEREINKDYYDIEDSLEINYKIENSALNLFGAAGAYSLSDFYFSDEINLSLEAVVSQPGTEDTFQEYLIEAGVSFFGHSEEIFTIDSSFYIPIDKDEEVFRVQGNVGYIWSQKPKEIIDLPLFSPEDEQTQIITHQEKISASFNSTFSTEIKHTTSFILPSHLTLSAFGLFGFEYSNECEEKTSLFGFSFGLSASILY